MNVLICGVVKNCSNKLVMNLNLALQTSELFKNSKIIIYENNSTDNTKNILNYYKTNHSKFVVISEDLNITKENSLSWAYTEVTGSDHSCRIEQISNARNKVIDEINKKEYDEYKYVIWIDLDSSGWEISGIKDSFDKKYDWDAIFANSFPYYDYYALRSDFFQVFGPEIIGEKFWENLPNNNFRDDKLIPLYSAFNGIGIYKKNIFKKYKYDFLVNDSIKTFYRNYIKNKSLDSKLLEIIETKDKKFTNGYRDEESNIFWKSNCGYDQPIICEHAAVNFALSNEGYKLFINPKMIYYR